MLREGYVLFFLMYVCMHVNVYKSIYLSISLSKKTYAHVCVSYVCVYVVFVKSHFC